MRRSTAAAIGTLTGAALIVGVRLSVAAPAVPVSAPSAIDLSDPNLDAEPSATGAPGKSDAGKKGSDEEASGEDQGNAEGGGDSGSGLANGVHKGSAVKNPYGTVQVSIRVSNGKITAADATFPTSNDSATINPPAVATLKEETLQAQSAEIDAVSGATFTSESYVKSLQAALDKAGA